MVGAIPPDSGGAVEDIGRDNSPQEIRQLFRVV